MDGRGSNRAECDVDEAVRRRFFPDTACGLFVDVGAAHPDFLSVSALYRSLGWKVLAIEPNPAFAALHRQRGHEVLEYACGDHDEDDVEFSVVDSHGQGYRGGAVSFESFSSLAIKESYAKLKGDLDVRKIRVKLRRLDTILSQHAPGADHIDIVSVDVEGWELEVLSGLDFGRFRPRALIVENLFDDPDYRSWMARKGYVLWRYLPPNDVYVPASAVGLVDRCVGRLLRAGLAAKRLLGSFAARPEGGAK